MKVWIGPQQQGLAEECPAEAEGGWQSLGFESGRRRDLRGCDLRWPESELLRGSVGAT